MSSLEIFTPHFGLGAQLHMRHMRPAMRPADFQGLPLLLPPLASLSDLSLWSMLPTWHGDHRLRQSGEEWLQQDDGMPISSW